MLTEKLQWRKVRANGQTTSTRRAVKERAMIIFLPFFFKLNVHLLFL